MSLPVYIPRFTNEKSTLSFIVSDNLRTVTCRKYGPDLAYFRSIPCTL